MKFRSTIAFILTLAMLATAVAQDPTPKQPAQQSDDDDVVRITTNLIQIDAIVTDKNGKLVTDLTAEDFEIEENGDKQQITNFSFVSNVDESQAPSKPAPTTANNVPAPPPQNLRKEQVRRTIALVVDDLGLSFQSVTFVRKALKKFVDEQMQPGDMVAIIRTGGGMGALQQFTSDKRILYAAIERLRWNQMGRGGVTPITPMEGRTIADQMKGDLPGATDDGTNPGAELNEFRNELFTVGTLGALNYIINGLRDLPGRKSLLLMSDGIKIYNQDNQTRRGAQLVGVNSVGPNRSDRILDTLRRLTDLANRASVVLYTMDARGLQPLNMTAEDNVGGLSFEQRESNLLNRRVEFFESQNGLNLLAQQTGGLAIRNTNDLSGGVQKMLDDQKSYYLIGYHPNENTFDPKRARFNKLKVKVRRDGLKVRYRSGFFGVTDEDSRPGPPVTRAQQLARAIVSPFSSGELKVQLTSLYGNDAVSGSFMRSLIHVDASNLTFVEETDGWRKFVFDIMAITFGDNGAVVDEVSRTENVRVRGGTYRLIEKYGFDYIITVPIKKPGAYQLRTAIRDSATERVGSAGQFVEVPDINKNRLALSGIVINGYQPEKLKNFAIANPNSGARPTNEPLTGPGVRRLSLGLIMEFGYVIYNPQLDKPTKLPKLQTQVRLFREGEQIFAGDVIPFDPAGQMDMKRLNAGGRLQLGTEMAPGDYVLQVVVTDLLAKEKQSIATQWIDFSVRDK